ncbi:eco57I restriction-modification methylase family protein [Lyngbya aestuarii BL J]|uniref:Eco57I restriction-modification methylase family protein n=1 Tax=Lyngbya aestuarii BL J TaxID=1348334 RepID=U7QBZ9_9CYAN|nr:eco57I restriction-modification methylase family protein [Lyngbya aestuarii]ERT05353.1 eco57I restriction-modification methylase family protein [Lyngbya aestuarii BL J]
MAGLAGKQLDLFAMSVQNTARIKEQNSRTISVIIGNPPDNAHQENFNQRNANRPYQGIDKAIKESYIKEGTAQNQIVVYDMYTRFFRWASDRLGKNGIIAFITNRSFIDSKTFDGFRKCIEREFDSVYIVDTQSDVRNNPKISGTKNNVFGIKTGIAVMFLVKNQEGKR